MPLKISLKPNEKVLIGTALIQNGHSKSELLIHSHVPVLRQRDIITEEEADTVAKTLYLLILNMYVYPSQERKFHELYFPLLKQMILMPFDADAIDLMVDMSSRIIAGDHYQALKLCRKLIDLETEILKS